MGFYGGYPSGWTIKNYLGKQKERVEQRLLTLPLVPGKATQVLEAMKYALQTPGKRFRPLLMLAATDIYKKGHLPFALDCAVALECIHTSSLLFDDLPSMDDASLRRGRKTTHVLYGEDQAILAGMSLIAEANLLITQNFSSRKSQLQRQIECLRIMNDSFSLDGLSGGQSDDLLNKQVLSFEELEYIHAKKTGTLFVSCVEMAAVIGGATLKERNLLKSYAKNLGLAFQIQDDLLDLEDSSTTGKDKGQDEGKTTFVNLFGVEKSQKLYEELIDVSLQNLEPLGRAAQHLTELTRIIQKRKH